MVVDNDYDGMRNGLQILANKVRIGILDEGWFSLPTINDAGWKVPEVDNIVVQTKKIYELV
ncbi:hypothetical protein BLOT_005576 [Blomia tropicalis]|nr:hypothetical protein BLOT_005576 [Blomia tropicalis]